VALLRRTRSERFFSTAAYVVIKQSKPVEFICVCSVSKRIHNGREVDGSILGKNMRERTRSEEKISASLCGDKSVIPLLGKQIETNDSTVMYAVRCILII
jgi:hypothetical protein